MDRQPIISAKDVEITFSLRGRKLNAIRKCSLDLYEGETLAIVGESGSGKSVFTKNFVGMLDANGKITGGSIMYEGRDMTKFTEKDWLGVRGKKIAMVMQDPMTSLNPLKTIGAQIMEAVALHQGLKGAAAKEKTLEYLRDVGIKVKYLHHDIDTMERMEILRDLRNGLFDVLVGINLLREGLDLPEVSLVAILDADKEGFLRSETSLIQTIGRAARNAQGLVILYADRVTPSMAAAMEETQRRREIQNAYNQAHGIVPKTIVKSVRDLIEISHAADGKERKGKGAKALTPKEKASLIAQLEQEMKEASRRLEFEYAAILRDQIIELRGASETG